MAEWVFRHCAPAHKDLHATLEQSRRWGGRYNAAGEFGAIYVACERATALRELDRRAAKLGISRGQVLPRLLLTLHVRLQNVLDLTDAAVRRAWDAELDDLKHEADNSRCLEIARAARRDGFEAIRFPSFTDGADNYAIFLDVLKPGSELTIEDEETVENGEP